MKKLFTLLFGMTVMGHAIANPVDLNTAKTIGYSFLSRTTNVSLAKGVNDLQVAYTATANVNGTSTPCYYVFNAANGFVIVSADDNVMPVLAYSNELPFGTAAMPAHVKWWMDTYTNQISYMIKNNIAATSDVKAKWNTLSNASNIAPLAKTTNVIPLLHTTWDQLPMYNAQCPGTGANLAVTGCVATAMAQVMKFWGWPAVGAGSHSYTDPNYGSQSADFGATAYNFSSMGLSLTSTSPAASQTAIAKLMYHCGVSVNMGYSPTGSGAAVELRQAYGQTTCAETALKTYFKYKPTLHGDSRTDYANTAAWVAALETDINAGRPVLYTGFGTSDGHCWVADGYETIGANTYFHFNWGWSGQSNGYFTVDSLAPPALGAGGGNGNFNNNQGAIFGIQPLTSIVAGTSNMKMNADINMPNSPQAYDQSFTFTANILNATGAAFTGDITAEVFDHNDKLVTTLPAISTTIPNNASTGAITFTPSNQNVFMMIPDVYSIRIYYRTNGGSWTLVSDNANYVNYSSLEIASDGGIQLVDSIYTTEGYTWKLGQPVSVTANLYNLIGSDFNGTLDAILFDPATQLGIFEVQQLPGSDIPYDNNSHLFTFASTANVNVTPGTYELIIGSYDATTGISPFGSTFYSNPVFITVPNKTGVANLVAESDVKIYPNPATDVVYVDVHGMSAEKITVLDIAGRIITEIPTANSAIVSVPVADYAPGIYLVQINTATGVINKKISVIK